MHISAARSARHMDKSEASLRTAVLRQLEAEIDDCMLARVSLFYDTVVTHVATAWGFYVQRLVT